MLAILLVTCARGPAEPVRRASPDAAAIERGVRSALDPAADPCTDFYQYACGGWIARVAPPSDRPQVMRSFTSVSLRNRSLLARILERPGADPGQRQAAAYYASCMDVAGVEAAGLHPLDPWLDEVDAVSDLRSAFAAAAHMRRVPDADPLVSLALERDPAEPTRRVLVVAPGGMGLPDPRLYVDPARRHLLDAYRSHVARMLELAGGRAVRARAEARGVVDLERALARAALEAAAAAGPSASAPPPRGRRGLAALDPALPWDAWFEALGPVDRDAVVATSPGFVRALGATLRATPRETLRAYLRWQLLDAAAPRLARAFDEEDFAFRAKLTGQTVMPPRPARCVDETVGALPLLVSRLWVEAALPEESRALARDMLQEIADRFAASLDDVDWMDAETRARAAAKARRVGLYAGHPADLPADAGFAVDPDHYLANAIAARERSLAHLLAGAGAVADPSEWPVAPFELRAFHDARANALYVPAGLLQPPFFDRAFPPAMRWGAIGPLMAHEWTHGFDAEGSLFDEDGRLAPWWSEATMRGYQRAGQCLVDRYDAYAVTPEVQQDGRRTFAENAADVGGVVLAHRAWRHEAGGAADAASPIPGLSNEQLFFVAYAQTWCASSQPAFDAMMARHDPRARPRFRANGPLTGLPAFRQAFACRADAPMAGPTCPLW